MNSLCASSPWGHGLSAHSRGSTTGLIDRVPRAALQTKGWRLDDRGGLYRFKAREPRRPRGGPPSSSCRRRRSGLVARRMEARQGQDTGRGEEARCRIKTAQPCAAMPRPTAPAARCSGRFERARASRHGGRAAAVLLDQRGHLPHRRGIRRRERVLVQAHVVLHAGAHVAAGLHRPRGHGQRVAGRCPRQ